MKRKLSWRFIIFGLLIATIVLLMVFLMAVNLYFYEQASETVRQSNTQSLRIRGQEVVTRLNAVREHVREMLWIVNDNAELKSGSQMMQLLARVSCQTSMDNKIAASSDIDYMFILDTDENFLLLSAGDQYSNQNAEVSKYLKQQPLNATSIRDNSWALATINNQTFFLKAYQLGKYVIGGLSSVQDYDQTLLGEISGTDTGYLLIKDDEVIYTGGYDWSGSVVLTDDGYTIAERGTAAAVYEMNMAQTKVVLITREDALQSILSSATISLGVISALFLLLLGLLMLVMTRLVSKPTQQMLVANQKIEAGDLLYRLTDEPASREFTVLHNSFNKMADQIVHLKILEYEQQLYEKESELKQLRAQIRPHFFLNAITTVMSMTYHGNNEDIRKYLTSLSGFMRYMLQITKKAVPVKDELDNVKHYLEMQKIRFPESVASFIGCEPGVEEFKVPYLLLFTVVENTFKHAMSLYNTLSILIQCERIQTEGFTGVRIIVEDNGDGFPEKVVAQYRTGKGIRELDGHIGLSNIYRTLQLLYGREDLLRIRNASPRGAHVELWIPLKEDEQR